MINLVLPFPPSLNHLWRNVSGRTLLSAAGRRYRASVAKAALLARPERFGDAEVALRIVAFVPDRRRRDLDNILKAALDGMQHAGLYDDDSQIVDLRIRRGGVDRAAPRLECWLGMLGKVGVTA